jgi:hypothetical protein
VKPNAFIGWKARPTDAELGEALGSAKPLWDHLVEDMAKELGLDLEWKNYGAKFGWAGQLRRGKRKIVHLSPCRGCIAVLFVFGDKAVKAARASRLGRTAEKLFDEAPRYPEGTGIRLEISGPKHLPLIKKLAKIKLES